MVDAASVLASAGLTARVKERPAPAARRREAPGSIAAKRVGVRPTLWLAVAVCFLAGGALAASPLRAVRRLPERPVEVLS